MRSRIAILGIGLAIGYAAGRFLPRGGEGRLTLLSFRESAAEPDEPSLTIGRKIAKPPHEEPIIDLAPGVQLASPGPAGARQPKLRIPEPDQHLAVSLDETEVSRLEARLADLRREAYTKAGKKGWELHLLKDSSVFAGMGFHDGDLITYESLGADGHPSELASRVAAVLKSLEER